MRLNHFGRLPCFEGKPFAVAAKEQIDSRLIANKFVFLGPPAEAISRFEAE